MLKKCGAAPRWVCISQWHIHARASTCAHNMTPRFAAAALYCFLQSWRHEAFVWRRTSLHHRRSLQLSPPDIHARASTCMHYYTTPRLRANLHAWYECGDGRWWVCMAFQWRTSCDHLHITCVYPCINCTWCIVCPASMHPLHGHASIDARPDGPRYLNWSFEFDRQNIRIQTLINISIQILGKHPTLVCDISYSYYS